MQSIITQYAGPTNTRGSRIIARSTSGIRRSYPVDNAKSIDENHKNAALTFAIEFGWNGHYVGGAYNDKGAQIWVREWYDRRDSFNYRTAE